MWCLHSTVYCRCRHPEEALEWVPELALALALAWE